MEGVPQVGPALRVEPEIRSVSEDSGEDERGRRSNRTALVTELIDMLAGDPHRFGEAGLGKAQGLHELLDEDFANTGGFSFGH